MCNLRGAPRPASASPWVNSCPSSPFSSSLSPSGTPFLPLALLSPSGTPFLPLALPFSLGTPFLPLALLLPSGIPFSLWALPFSLWHSLSPSGTPSLPLACPSSLPLLWHSLPLPLALPFSLWHSLSPLASFSLPFSLWPLPFLPLALPFSSSLDSLSFPLAPFPSSFTSGTPLSPSGTPFLPSGTPSPSGTPYSSPRPLPFFLCETPLLPLALPFSLWHSLSPSGLTPFLPLALPFSLWHSPSPSGTPFLPLALPSPLALFSALPSPSGTPFLLWHSLSPATSGTPFSLCTPFLPSGIPFSPSGHSLSPSGTPFLPLALPFSPLRHSPFHLPSGHSTTFLPSGTPFLPLRTPFLPLHPPFISLLALAFLPLGTHFSLLAFPFLHLGRLPFFPLALLSPSSATPFLPLRTPFLSNGGTPFSLGTPFSPVWHSLFFPLALPSSPLGFPFSLCRTPFLSLGTALSPSGPTPLFLPPGTPFLPLHSLFSASRHSFLLPSYSPSLLAVLLSPRFYLPSCLLLHCPSTPLTTGFLFSHASNPPFRSPFRTTLFLPLFYRFLSLLASISFRLFLHSLLTPFSTVPRLLDLLLSLFPSSSSQSNHPSNLSSTFLLNSSLLYLQPLFSSRALPVDPSSTVFPLPRLVLSNLPLRASPLAHSALLPLFYRSLFLLPLAYSEHSNPFCLPPDTQPVSFYPLFYRSFLLRTYAASGLPLRHPLSFILALPFYPPIHLAFLSSPSLLSPFRLFFLPYPFYPSSTYDPLLLAFYLPFPSLPPSTPFLHTLLPRVQYLFLYSSISPSSPSSNSTPSFTSALSYFSSNSPSTPSLLYTHSLLTPLLSSTSPRFYLPSVSSSTPFYPISTSLSTPSTPLLPSLYLFSSIYTPFRLFPLPPFHPSSTHSLLPLFYRSSSPRFYLPSVSSSTPFYLPSVSSSTPLLTLPLLYRPLFSSLFYLLPLGLSPFSNPSSTSLPLPLSSISFPSLPFSLLPLFYRPSTPLFYLPCLSPSPLRLVHTSSSRASRLHSSVLRYALHALASDSRRDRCQLTGTLPPPTLPSQPQSKIPRLPSPPFFPILMPQGNKTHINSRRLNEPCIPHGWTVPNSTP
ncbi:hypothetical protein C7M84_018089 [Penaeus vannamei]|uniref:Uncharacterized protein n=1 Tax=Penaeus vannamei TaxID=6689 RepID=A0A3R7LTJ2_PENVA|nr:hypothetical protein C7M84_018089 [Penaeus vannamei]